MDDLPYSQGIDGDHVQVVYGDVDIIDCLDNDSQDERCEVQRRSYYNGCDNASLLTGSESPQRVACPNALADQVFDIARGIQGIEETDSYRRAHSPGASISPEASLLPASLAPANSSAWQPPVKDLTPHPLGHVGSQALHHGRGGAPQAAAVSGFPLQGVPMGVDEDLLEAFQSNSSKSKMHVTSPNHHHHHHHHRGRARGYANTPLRGGCSASKTPGSTHPRKTNPFTSLLASSPEVIDSGNRHKATPPIRSTRARGPNGGSGTQRTQSRFRQPCLESGADANADNVATPFPRGFDRNARDMPSGEEIVSSSDDEAEGDCQEGRGRHHHPTPPPPHLQHTTSAENPVPMVTAQDRGLSTPEGFPVNHEGGPGASIQRTFLSKLDAPPPSKAALSRMVRKKGGGFGGGSAAGGLQGRLHSVLRQEKALAGSQGSTLDCGTAGIQLKILKRTFQDSVVKCHCRWAGGAHCSGNIGSVSEVIAILSSRSENDVDTRAGSVILVRPPYHVNTNPGCGEVPLLMCVGNVSQLSIVEQQ